MTDSLRHIKQNLRSYKKKFYTNTLVKGLIFFISLSISVFLLFCVLEYLGNFNSIVRTTLFYSYLITAFISLIRWVGIPIKQLLNLKNELSDEEAAKQIGKHFPEIKDRLLNTLQLANIDSNTNSLVSASISQRYEKIKDVSFSNAIKIKDNKKYFNKYMLIPLVLFLILFIGYSKELKKSTDRIIKHNKEFVAKNPFNLVFVNYKPEIFRGDSYTVKVKIKGDKIPNNLRIVISGQKFLMNVKNKEYTYHFNTINKNIEFTVEYAGYESEIKRINVIDRPQLNGLKILAKYPSYIGLKDKVYKNTGSLNVPEGTYLYYELITGFTDSVFVYFNNENKKDVFNKVGEKFKHKLKVDENIYYTLKLKNLKTENKDVIKYKIDVIKDEHPLIAVNQIKDTIFYDNIIVAGEISDDYGITKLNFVYTNNDDILTKIPIEIRDGVTNQEFFFQKNLKDLGLEKGNTLKYYFEVYDNDGINGNKLTKSNYLTLVIPSKEILENNLEKEKRGINKSYEKTLSKSEELKKKLNKLTEELKSKKTLDWQDKAKIEQLLDEHKELKNQLVENQKKKNLNEQKEEQLTNKNNKELLEKMKKLDELMKEVMDEEFQKLMEDLEKLLNKKNSDKDLKEKLEELERKDESLQQELDRNIEMMKKFQIEQKLNKLQDELEKLAKKQKKLAKETEENKDKNKKEGLIKKQEDLKKEFQKLRDKHKAIKELNKELQNPEKMDDMLQEQNSIQESQQESKDQLDKNQNKKSAKAQKDAAEKMQKMAEAIKSMMAKMQGQQLEENIKDLKALLDNLIHLSYSQEKIMNEFRDINQRDPRFITLSQQQIKVNIDSKIIKDSLITLAKRIPEIEAFVMDEINDLTRYMEQSSSYIKARLPRKAASKQQYSMTSANNLALMLSDILKNLQQQMAQKKKSQGKPNSMCNKPGGSKPSSSSMQKQMKSLKQMMQDIKNGKKKSREISQQLSKMAAQQEMMRRAYEKMLQKKQSKSGDKNGKNSLEEAIKMMKMNEKDFFNNKISNQTIKRQQEIQTRMLEFDKAKKERDLDKDRKAETATNKTRTQPTAIDYFFKEKKKQLELLKTIPPDLKPYYRKKINKYFQGVENKSLN